MRLTGLQDAFDREMDDRLAPATDRLGVAVSGGSDSVALLLLASDWAARRGIDVHVATVDHALRAEAADEAAFVERLSDRIGVPCSRLSLDWSRHSGRVSMQDAREARHKRLANWAHETSIGQILLGHTQDDVCETMLMRIRAGSGWYGLPGLLPASASPAWPEGLGISLLRPLLSVGRRALQDELRKAGQNWIDDPTNANLQYERPRTRRLVAALSGKARASLAGSAQRLTSLHHARDQAVLSDMQRAVEWRADGSAHLSRPELNTLNTDIRCKLLQLVAMCVSGQEQPPSMAAIRNFNEKQNHETEIAVTIGDCWFVWSGAIGAIYRRPAGEARTAGAPDLARGSCVAVSDHPCWDGRISLSADEMSAGDQVQPLERARRTHQAPPRPAWLKDDRAARTWPVLVDQAGTVRFPQNASALHEARMMHLLQSERATVDISVKLTGF